MSLSKNESRDLIVNPTSVLAFNSVGFLPATGDSLDDPRTIRGRSERGVIEGAGLYIQLAIVVQIIPKQSDYRLRVL